MLIRAQLARQTRRQLRRFPALLALALLSGGCAFNQYMGISLQPGAADPALQALAVKAQGGDKQAQYELGRWFEESTDPNGLKKAIKLYRIAAIPRGGTRLLYTPGSSGVTTSVISAGPKIEPNKAAEERLRLISADLYIIDRFQQIRKSSSDTSNRQYLISNKKLSIKTYDKNNLVKRYQDNTYINVLCATKGHKFTYEINNGNLLFRFGRSLGPATILNDNNDDNSIPTYIIFDDIAEKEVINLLSAQDRASWIEYSGASYLWKISGIYAKLPNVKQCNRGQPVNGLIIIDNVKNAMKIEE